MPDTVRTTLAAAISAGGRRHRVLAGCLSIVCLAAQLALAADGAPGVPFVPDEISVGEPIVLPSSPPTAPAAIAPRPVDPVRGGAAAAAVPGNGWIGLAVAESRAPGRWVVAEVVPASPAAAAGILEGDDIRAINGTVLRTADDVAQCLTAIAPGQPVSVAIARNEAVTDVRMTAVPRPAPEQAPPQWQAGAADPRAAAAPRFAPAPTEPAMLPPPATPPTSVLVSPPTAAAFAAAPATGFAPAVPEQRSSPLPTPGPAAFQPVAPPPAFGGPAAAGRGRTALGVRTMPIDPATQSRFRLPAPQGAYVIGVVQDLPAARAGLPPGSVIVALDARPVGSPDELTRLVTSGPVGRPVALEYVLPGGETKKAEVVLQSLELPLERALVGPEPVATAPTLQPGPSPAAPDAFLPYRSDRPVDPAALEAARAEIHRLRARLDQLERRLGAGRD